MALYLIIFTTMFLVYLWYAFSVVYHFIRFGVGVRAKALAFFYFAGSFVLFVAVLVAFSQVSWSGLSLSVFNFGSGGPSNPFNL